MKIATFNINDVTKRLPVLLKWLAQSSPDIVCLQELKATQRDFPHAEIAAAGYGAVWKGQRSWNGVAILARGADPVLTRLELPGDVADPQSRYIEAAVRGVLIGCLYLPNGNPRPGPRFVYKLAWLERLVAHAQGLIDLGVPAILAGDYNVVPTAADIYPTRSWDQDALVQPECRALFQLLIEQGWLDALLSKAAARPLYTFWDYKRNAWERDAGLRLDHLLVSPILAGRLIDAGVDRQVRGWEGASDHAPAWAAITDIQSPVLREPLQP